MHAARGARAAARAARQALALAAHAPRLRRGRRADRVHARERRVLHDAALVRDALRDARRRDAARDSSVAFFMGSSSPSKPATSPRPMTPQPAQLDERRMPVCCTALCAA